MWVNFNKVKNFVFKNREIVNYWLIVMIVICGICKTVKSWLLIFSKENAIYVLLFYKNVGNIQNMLLIKVCKKTVVKNRRLVKKGKWGDSCFLQLTQLKHFTGACDCEQA